MRKKNQLKNVSFGGDWSENILSDYEKKYFLKKLQKLYEHSFFQKIPEEELEEVVCHLRNHLEKGEIFAQSIKDKIKIKDPYQRKCELLKTIYTIKKWL